MIKPVRFEVLGVPVDLVRLQDTLDEVQRMLDGSITHSIVAVNPEKVMAARRDAELFNALRNASLLIPDGIGIVLAARLLGASAIERVAGSDLMPTICEIAANQGKRIFLYGAKPGVASQAASILQDRFPNLLVAGIQHGYVTDDEMPEVVRLINNSGAEVLFVGLGSPRQELWIGRHRALLPGVKICQGVGGTFDAICGNPPRAPTIFRRLYLEWLYRLVTQPNRMSRQSALPRFAYQVARQAAAKRRSLG